MQEEKRKHPRFQVQVFAIIGDKKVSHMCFSQNLSKEGIYLTTLEAVEEEVLSPGNKITLSFTPPLHTDPVQVEGEVVRSEIGLDKEGKTITGIAVKFTSVPNEASSAINVCLGESRPQQDETTFEPIGLEPLLMELKSLALSKRREPTRDPLIRTVRDQYAMLSPYYKKITAEHLQETDSLESIKLDVRMIMGILKVSVDRTLLERLQRQKGKLSDQDIRIGAQTIALINSLVEESYQKTSQHLIQQGDSEELKKITDLKNKLNESLENFQKFLHRAILKSDEKAAEEERKKDLKDTEEHEFEIAEALANPGTAVDPKLKSFINILSQFEKDLFAPNIDNRLLPARKAVALMKKMAAEILFFKHSDLNDTETAVFLKQIFRNSIQEYTLIHHKLSSLVNEFPQHSQNINSLLKKLERIAKRMESCRSSLPETTSTKQPVQYEHTKASKESKTDKNKDTKRKASTKKYFTKRTAVLTVSAIAIAAIVILKNVDFTKKLDPSLAAPYLPVTNTIVRGKILNVTVDMGKWSKIDKKTIKNNSQRLLNSIRKDGIADRLVVKSPSGKTLLYTLCGQYGCFVAFPSN